MIQMNADEEKESKKALEEFLKSEHPWMEAASRAFCPVALVTTVLMIAVAALHAPFAWDAIPFAMLVADITALVVAMVKIPGIVRYLRGAATGDDDADDGDENLL